MNLQAQKIRIFHRETPKASNIRILKIPKDSKEVFQRIPKRCSKDIASRDIFLLRAKIMISDPTI